MSALLGSVVVSSAFGLSLAATSVFKVSPLACTGAWASSCFLSAVTDFAGSASEVAASDFVSGFDATAVTAGALSACTVIPSRGEDLPPDGVASDIVNEALVG